MELLTTTTTTISHRNSVTGITISFKDFANANMIGVNGLNGLSWPDLDMLPFGWLTDPGNKARLPLFLCPV
ncbi:hypothetical protein RIF29_29901 [Crotalaria pallida]|uniref:Alpha-galactosidase n=1 Tax=Crotalaria pallida TaxID=3830 RepID=A0AAN9I0U0_CROPI